MNVKAENKDKGQDGRFFKVVLIEDDPMVQEVNRQFVEQVDGFQVVGIAGNGQEGLRLIRELKPDLVFLDVFMPALDGMAALRELRSAAMPVDVIVVTAAKDPETIREMLRGGAMDYIIKPFKLERIRQTLERYRDRHESLAAEDAVTQDELDRMLLSGENWVQGQKHGYGQQEAGQTGPAGQVGQAEQTRQARQAGLAGLDEQQSSLPKGLNAATLRQIVEVMHRLEGGVSAEEAAEGIGIARVTARRYLDFLEKSGYVKLEINYGGVGRPINRYVLQQRPK
ncbi:two-component system, CitB family, response regulator DctR [Paenibacillus algorifonticola]|uniref:Two-component system, CitB family, response regulator DctR n=1 Tax=Paenibacillus algorifonticola TaxID=684063 RepID=A0A1I2IHQ0_9BACL|nr:response regulator [Paenibacillus algorifonticola]SFF40366.1 two-component system, CitB family, response regulator DctR [Paenibacillus algorifonticola]